MNTAEAKIPSSNLDGNWQSIDIYLFSNGQQYSPPRKYHLRAEELNLWDDTLSYLARLHYGSQHPLIFLYTTDGRKIEGPLELKDATAYVAVEPTDAFIEAGYEKYLIRASRSWEKRQAKKGIPLDLTGDAYPECEHDQPCCLCPQREICENEPPCCICPEKEDIINIIESEESIFVTSEIIRYRAPDEDYLLSEPEKCNEDCCPCDDDEPETDEPEVKSDKRGALMDENNFNSAENGQLARDYEYERNESHIHSHTQRLDDRSANRSRIGELITRLDENEPWTTNYQLKPDDRGTKIEKETKICDRRSKIGEYGQFPSEYEGKIIKHLTIPHDEVMPSVNETRLSEQRLPLTDRGSKPECNSKISEIATKLSDRGNIPAEKGFKAISYVPANFITKPSIKEIIMNDYGRKSFDNESKNIDDDPKIIENGRRSVEYEPKFKESDPKITENERRSVVYEPKFSEGGRKMIVYGRKSVDREPKMSENGQHKSVDGGPKMGEGGSKVSDYRRRSIDRGPKMGGNASKLSQFGRRSINRAIITSENRPKMPEQEPLLTDRGPIRDASGPRSIENEFYVDDLEGRINNEDRKTNEIELRMDGITKDNIQYISRPSGNDVRAVENGEGEIECYERPREQERSDEPVNKTVEYETISRESRRTLISHQGKPENRSRLSQQGSRLVSSGLGAPLGYAYVSEAQQHIRKSSISTSRPSIDSKKGAPTGQNPTTVRKLSSNMSPSAKKRLEEKKIVKDIIAPKIGNKAPVKTSNGGRLKTVQKYQNKTIPPLPVTQTLTTMIDKPVMKTIATSLTNITSSNKFQPTDNSHTENMIDNNIASTNIFRNQESEIASLKLNSSVKPVLDRFNSPSPENKTFQPVPEYTSPSVCFTLENTVPDNQVFEKRDEGIQEVNEQGPAVSSTKQITRASSQIRISRTPSVVRKNVENPLDGLDGENFIAIINKGDVVNLKLNIEVRNAEKKFSTSKTQKSRSLTNITTTEKGSQVSVEEEIIVQTKSIQSLLNQECLRGSGFEGRPKVLIVQCACCGQRTNISPRFDPTTSPTSTCDDSKKYPKVTPCSLHGVINDRCDLDPLNCQKTQSIIKFSSSAATPKKTLSVTSLHTLAMEEKRKQSIEMQANSISQTENLQTEYVASRRKVSITEDQKTSSRRPSEPSCQQIMSSCPHLEPSYHQILPSNNQIVQSFQQILPTISGTRCATSADAESQTQWCNILLEARRHENGRYSFHLPPLQVLRYYKPSQNN